VTDQSQCVDLAQIGQNGGRSKQNIYAGLGSRNLIWRLSSNVVNQANIANDAFATECPVSVDAVA